MRDLYSRSNLEFIGENADRFNSMKREWSQLLQETSKNTCGEGEDGDPKSCRRGMNGELKIELQIGKEEKVANNQADDCYYFESEKALNEFSRMFFYYFNNDGAFAELDYADFREAFSSLNCIGNPIQYLQQAELPDLKTGMLFCIELLPNFERASLDLVSLAKGIENAVGDEVVVLLTMLRIPKINKKEVAFFYTANMQTQS